MLINRTPTANLVCTLIAILVSGSNTMAGGVLLVDDDAPAGGDGIRWDTAYRFLQDALADAAGGGISEIHVAQGIYTPDSDDANPDGTGVREATFHLLNSVALMGGYAGIGAKDPDAHDIELFETILSGDLLGNDEPDFVNNDENSIHVTMGSNVDATALLEGFTITAGNANGAADPNDRGGGFYASPTDASIIHCNFEANFAALFGGGLYSNDGSLIILNSTFLENKVDNGNCADGGGVALEFDSFGTPTIDSCIFLGNSATHAGAGLLCLGLFEEGGTIENCTFEGNFITGTGSCNSANGGGGIIIFFATDMMQIINCTFTNNSVSNPDGVALGGGLVIVDSESLVLNCDFRGNSSNGFKEHSLGGAIHIQSCSPQIVNCLVVDNSSILGGGISNLGGNAKYVGCTIAGNASAKGGGEFYTRANGEPLLINCILWNNGQQPIILDEDGAATIVNYSNIQGGWAGAGSNNIDADPLFVDPGSGDYRLLAGSPCIDAADSSAIPVDINIDLDGNPRFIEDPNTKDTGQGICLIVDMGSYEFQEGTPDCCQGDLDGNGSVGTSDLLELFAQWGTAGSADFDGDGNVGTSDLLILFANWGPCG